MNHRFQKRARLTLLLTARVIVSVPCSLFWIFAAWHARLETAISNLSKGDQ